jgi:hypothetical protein
MQQYLLHYHEAEPSGQGKSNIVSFSDEGKRERGKEGKRERGKEGAVRCRERLGGLLRYYEREAA